ncbi:MAG: RagB/SusD family nutrient uptake outer membrane protein [Paludibacter sp.]
MSDYSYYKEQWWYSLVLTGDDLHQGVNAYSQKLYNSDILGLSNGFRYMYKAIDASNLCIKKIPNIQGDSAKREQLLGEAYFLRAMNYFNVIRYFGKAVVTLEPYNGLDNVYLPFQKKDSVYKVIESDLLAAAKRLPLAKSASATVGRPSKGSAQAILSLVYLTEEKWQLAANYADSVILSNQYSLIKDYAQLWNVDKESLNFEENIFSMQYIDDITTSGAGSMGSIYAYQFCPASIPRNTGTQGTSVTDPTRGVGSGAGLRVHCYFFDEYFFDYDIAKGGKVEYSSATEKDYRIDKSFFYGNWKGVGTTVGGVNYGKPIDVVFYPGGKGNDPNTTATGTNFGSAYPCILKYRDPNGLDTRNHANDFIIIRLAEVYLIKAEAANELGKTTDAYTAFNKVRERARLANSTNGGAVRTVPTNLRTGLSKQDFRLAVLKERGLELIGEGHRWFDLVRMKMDDGRSMYEYRLSSSVSKTPYKTFPAASLGTSLQSLVYYPRCILYPIPNDEFNKNPAVSLSEQNAGY